MKDFYRVQLRNLRSGNTLCVKSIAFAIPIKISLDFGIVVFSNNLYRTSLFPVIKPSISSKMRVLQKNQQKMTFF